MPVDQVMIAYPRMFQCFAVFPIEKRKPLKFVPFIDKQKDQSPFQQLST
jgi:hypothetical protein